MGGRVCWAVVLRVGGDHLQSVDLLEAEAVRQPGPPGEPSPPESHLDG